MNEKATRCRSDSRTIFTALSVPSQTWADVRALMTQQRLCLGPEISRWWRREPETLGLYAATYRLASRLIGVQRRVLDWPCREGFGAWLLSQECGPVTGVDEPVMLNRAKNIWPQKHVSWGTAQDLAVDERWDALVCWKGEEKRDPWSPKRAQQKRQFCKNDGQMILAGNLRPEMARWMKRNFRFCFAFEVSLAGIRPVDSCPSKGVIWGCEKNE